MISLMVVQITTISKEKREMINFSEGMEMTQSQVEKETTCSEEMEELTSSLVETVMIPLMLVRIMMTSKEKQVMIDFLLVMEMT